jgi:hypothetical protein
MSLGAAVRVHYWRKHRDVMLGEQGAKRKRSRK